MTKTAEQAAARVVSTGTNRNRPNWLLHPFRAISLLSLLGMAAGCATMRDKDVEVVQFDPVPVAELSQQDLEPVEPRSLTELLLAARDALEAGNLAHERENFEAAYREYVVMLELLAEAEPDPETVYALRTEFERILDQAMDVAKRYERHAPEDWTEEVRELTEESELEFPDPLPDRVLSEIDSIQNVYGRNFQAGLNRSYRYMPYILEVWKEAGLPEDLAWLAMVESQFSPNVTSRAGAKGMWQFMKFTGHRYGLRTTPGLDERLDWKKATHAAAAYLKELYVIFDGSWPLAVSAYNMGEAGLGRAIEANGGERDLWKLIETPPASRRIRQETKRFYPRLLATAIVAKDPERYGFEVTPHAADDTEYVTVDTSYSLAQLESEAGLSRGTLSNLNPQILSGYTPFNTTVQLHVPKSAHTKMARAIETVPPLRPDTHVVARGETLSGIAALHGVSLAELSSVNNIRSPKRLQIGRRLVIPGRVSYAAQAGGTTSGDRLVYTVSRGDSLSTIASRYRVSVRDIQRWNELGRSSRIYIGDRLYVSPPPINRTPTTGEPIMYTVRSGDYPEKIAHAHNVALDDLLAWNGLSKRSIIRPGEQLKIYGQEREVRVAKSTESVEESGAPIAHTVRRGESASVIAAKYSVATSELLAWNNLTANSIIREGDTLLINASASDTEDGGKIMHVVRRGQSPWLIAKRYGVNVNDLYDWNRWDRSHVLQIGESVVIYK